MSGHNLQLFNGSIVIMERIKGHEKSHFFHYLFQYLELLFSYE